MNFDETSERNSLKSWEPRKNVWATCCARVDLLHEAHQCVLTTQVHPRTKNRMIRIGTGIPISHNKIQPIFPLLELCFGGFIRKRSTKRARQTTHSRMLPMIFCRKSNKFITQKERFLRKLLFSSKKFTKEKICPKATSPATQTNRNVRQSISKSLTKKRVFQRRKRKSVLGGRLIKNQAEEKNRVPGEKNLETCESGAAKLQVLQFQTDERLSLFF